MATRNNSTIQVEVEHEQPRVLTFEERVLKTLNNLKDGMQSIQQIFTDLETTETHSANNEEVQSTHNSEEEKQMDDHDEHMDKDA